MEGENGSAYHAMLAPLSSDGESSSPGGLKTRGWSLKSTLRWAIKVVSWVVFVAWAAVMIFFPLDLVQDLVQDWISLTQYATLYGSTGSFLVAFSGPVLLIALLAASYLSLSDHHLDSYYQNYLRRKSSKNRASYSLWTFPAVVDGPFGIISGAELIAILVFVASVVFGVIFYTIESISDVSYIHTSFLLKCSSMLEQWGAQLGMIGLFCLVFLFIPVARGSVLLRLVDIPFEHATRYHVWLGHLTMFIFTLHGMSYVVSWTIQGNLLQELFSWEVQDSIVVLPGLIALTCGLLMWATSLYFFRRNYFELFFYTHYLYIGFLIFFALHVGDFIFSVALGGILIFMLDRFLRFCQSRKTVDIISVTRHSSGAIELAISKPTNLKYNALSFVFVKARELSLLQWHPFSVSSSPMDGENHVKVLVKVLGDWTKILHDKVSSICHEDEDYEQGKSTQVFQSRTPLTASIEGPYGHETPYYLKYKNIVLVAGGIGISPFLAILRDVLHRIKQGRSLYPSSILVVWAIKRSNELSLIPDLESICPSFSDLLDLEIHVFVTQQSASTSVEEGKTYENSTHTSIYKGSKRCSMSRLVGTGDKNWNSIYVSMSIIGFIAILGLVDEYVVNPYDLSNSWYIGLVLFACMAASVVLVGGLVAILWHFSDRKTSVLEERDFEHGESVGMLQNHNVDGNKTVNVQYGCRPNFEEWGAQNYTTMLLPSSSSTSNAAFEQIRRKSVVKSLARRGIKFIAGLIFIAWFALMFFFPLNYVKALFSDTGSVLLAFSGPILLIALLAALHGTLSDDHEDIFYEEYARKKGSAKHSSYSLWTFPVLVDGPFGVVSGAEFIGILLFVAAVVSAIIAYTTESISESSSSKYSDLPKSAVILKLEGGKLGAIGMICLAFLFIPVARGSVLLQLIDIPFEHAIRYHVWLGNLTVLIFTLHGLCIIVAWTIEGKLLDGLLTWGSNHRIAKMPGVIALACGLLMWSTSLHLVRRKYFELFYYTHHLYIGFVVFLVLHVSDYYFSIALGGILIFMLDRLLRFCQSRKIVDVISMTRHSCGVIELVISKPTNLRYNAMSFVFINAHKLSLLQWHPFSVSSSPVDSKNHLTILVKAIGDWTTKLNNQASDRHRDDEDEPLESTPFCQSRIPLKVSLEGPYGHDTPYYLLYKNLVLVAGGIGISPFVAILRDIMNRAKDGRSIVPSNVLLIWAIKGSDELSLLPDLESICPSFSNLLDIEIQVYITRQPQTAFLEEGDTYKTLNSYQNSPSSICPLVGTGDKKWNAIYVSSSIVGFVAVFGLLDEYYVKPFDVIIGWYKGLLLLGCMVTSVVIVGGLVAALWHLSSRKEDDNIMNQPQNFGENKMRNVQNQIDLMATKYGYRPNFKEIFESMEEKFGSIDVGVMVCGPPSLESSVAKEIRSRSFHRKKNNPIFHFHSHSFQL